MSVIDRVLARLPDARRASAGWQARCPAHEDRSPSLSIREGSGAILLHCFAGCDTSEIVAALGLRMADLFDEPLHPQALAAQTRAPETQEEIDDTIESHLQRIIDEETKRLGYVPPITSRHRNRAQAAVSRILHIELQPVAPAWWEGQPHDDDPLWPVFAERALQEILWERGHVEPTMEDKMDAEERAAEWIRYEARRKAPTAPTHGTTT